MASDKIVNPIFNWGDTVVIKKIAPECYKPGLLGSVCGVSNIDSEELAIKFNQKMNSELYLIEFGDGETLEIPGCYLNPLE